MEQLIRLYEQWAGGKPATIEKVKGAGSNRIYYRLTDDAHHSVIGVVGTSREENHAFISLAKHFGQRQLPVPEILAASDDEMRYLQTDLGHVSLFDAIQGGREAGGRYNLKEVDLLRRTIRELPNIQIRGARGLDFSQCYPQPEFDQDSVLFDLNYFKYCFLKATEIDFHEMKLEANFRMFAKDLTAEPMEAFLYRDFQARNVMLDDEGNPFFIDFQGGRKGPFYYDLASFLWQASAKYSFKLRRELIFEYYQSLKQYTEVPSSRHFAHRLALFVLFRTLQVLGAYGFRGYFEHKRHFIDSIPGAIQNLRDLLALDRSTFPYPYLSCSAWWNCHSLRASRNQRRTGPMDSAPRRTTSSRPTRWMVPPHSRNTTARARWWSVYIASPTATASPRTSRATAEAMSSTAEARTTRDAMSRIRN